MKTSPKSPSRKRPVEHAPVEHSHAYLSSLGMAPRQSSKGPAPVFAERHGRLVRVSP